MNEATAYFEQSSAPLAGRGVWVWLYWLSHYMGQWLGLSNGLVRSGESTMTPVDGYKMSRSWRHMDAYFVRCGLPPARNFGPYALFLPRGLSPTQRQERISRISVLGRVRIYRISRSCSVLLRRPLLRCYDHGWWRAPISRLYAQFWLVYLRPN